MEKLRKIFTVSVMAMTILAMSVVVVPGAGATASAGDLIKMSGLSSVYYLAADGKRYVFPNEQTYFSWYSDFSGVVTIPQSELESYPLGANVTIRPGTKLVKITTDPKVYAVEANGTLVWVPDEATAIALYGENWAKRVVDVPDGFFTNYSVSTSQISASAYPQGSLIKLPSASDVYYIDVDGTARKITSEAAFTANRFKWSDVITASASFTLPTLGSDISSAESDLIDTSSGAGGTAGAGTGLTIALASDTPASGTAVKNAARVPFTKINLTASADGAISVKLKIQRNGLSVDTDFTSISFLEGIKQLGNVKTLNSDHQCLSDSITIPAGTTKSITIAGNIRSDGTNTSAGVANLGVVEAITTATVSGSLPINGNDMTFSNAVSIGTATLARGSYDPNTTANKEVGTTGYDFISFKITAQTEAQQVEYIKFTDQGSIADSDLANVKLYVDNNFYMNGAQVSKKVEFDLTGSPVTIAKGGHKEFSLIADIVGGSGRNIDFDIDKTTDVAVKGLNYGYYITPSAALNAGNIVTITAGTFTVSKSNDVPTANIAMGENNVALGSFIFRAQGEGVDITQATFAVEVAGSGNSLDVSNCTLYDASGNAVTGAVTPSAATTLPSSTTYGTTTFTDTISVPEGENVYTMKCNLNTDFSTDDTITVKAAMQETTYWVMTGETTGDNIAEAPAGTTISANTQTIKAGSLASYTASTPVAQSIVKGSQQVLFTNIILDATASGEDVRVTQMVITDTTGTTAKTININNIKLYVNGVAKSVVKNGTSNVANTNENFTFSLSGSDVIIVPKGSSVTVQVKADVSASAVTNATHTFDLSGITAQGDDTGETINSTPSGNGQPMTIAANGTLTTALASDNPESSLMAAGSTGNIITALQMEAAYEDVELDQITLTASSTPAASSTANDVSKLYLYDEDGNQIVAATPTSNTYVVTIPDYTTTSGGAWASGFKIAEDDSDGAKLYVKADLASIGTGLPGTSGHQITYRVALATDVVATGMESGQGATESGTADGNTHWIYKSIPTVALVSLPTDNLANGTATLFKFSITANAQGALDFGKATFTVATTGARVTSLKLYDVSGGTEVELNASGVEVAPSTNIAEILIDTAKIRTVTAGATKTFALKGTVTGSDGSDTISTQMNGDDIIVTSLVSYPASRASIDLANNAEDDFIWSDRSASSHSADTLDWTNGYLVSGLNSSVSSAQVLQN